MNDIDLESYNMLLCFADTEMVGTAGRHRGPGDRGLRGLLEAGAGRAQIPGAQATPITLPQSQHGQCGLASPPRVPGYTRIR